MKNSIQTGFGGIGLPTTIKQPDESITDFGNFVAVQEHKTHTVDVSDFGVARLPIDAFGDGSIHLGFDLTHGVAPFG
jgi:hypothetical protein